MLPASEVQSPPWTTSDVSGACFFGHSNILGKNLKTLSYRLWLEHISEAVF